MKKIPLSFYTRKDVVAIAKDLIGKIIVTNFDGNITSGRIVETEAYVAITDKASHSFGGKRTAEMNTCMPLQEQRMSIYVMAFTK